MTQDAASGSNPAPARVRLDGHVALVNGAGQPLGRAIATALAEAGADVAVAGVRREEHEIFQVASAANQIWSLGRRNLALEVDATDPADVEASIQQVHAEWGRLDILVNAHDQMLVVPFDETGRDEWDAALATNLTAVALACQAAGHVMMLQGSGRMINIVSAVGAHGVPRMAAYAAASGGVEGLTRALAHEWAGRAINVNAIRIGFYADQPGIADNPEQVAALRRALPSEGLVRSEDVAAACVWLAAAAAAISGQIIALHGVWESG